jgi:L,D-peptidoglycan transpeptidase YkuD (ErfK/YbiS/YcfS/YnhG family)
VRLPYPASAEAMWRADHLYDLVVVLDHNQRPRIRGGGSAIFMHLARPGFAATEGCVALEPAALRRMLAWCGPGSVIEVC